MNFKNLYFKTFNLLKIFFFVPHLLRFYFQILITIFQLNQNKSILLIRGDNFRLDTVCHNSKKLIYFRKNYTTIFLPSEHIAKLFFNPAKNILNIFLNKRIIKVISDEHEKDEWDFSLSWNSAYDIHGNPERSILTSDSLQEFKKNNDLILYFPLLKKIVKRNFSSVEPYPMYIGGIDENLKIRQCDSQSLINDYPLNEFTKDLEKFYLKRQYSRLYFVKSLKENYGDLFHLYGTKKWGLYDLKSKSIGFDKKTRMKEYAKAGICVDFLPQTSNSCIYNRSLEIFNSGSILIQWKAFNSEIVFGKEYSDLFCFYSVNEMISKIDEVRSNGLDYYDNIRKNAIRKIQIYQDKINLKTIKKCKTIITNQKKNKEKTYN